MGIRQEAKQQSRQKIIDAMRLLLQEKEADSINIEDITTKAGIAKGSFYTHFKRKEDVISVIAMEEYNAMTENVLALSGDAYDRICEYLCCSAKIIDEMTLQVAQNWMKSVTAPIEDEHGRLDKYSYDCDNIRRLLTDGIERSELADDTPTDAVTEIIMNAYYGAVANWCITGGEKDLVTGIEGFCKNGLKIILNQYKTGGN